MSLPKPPQSAVTLALADYKVESPYTTVVNLVRLSDGQYLALSARDPNMGCTVPWNAQAQVFANPCHGAKYNIRGEVVSGPAIRGLDRFPVRVDMAHKELIIDVGTEPQHGPLPNQ
jgi:cytochrome b6-f complex iron-sulfur subunit